MKAFRLLVLLVTVTALLASHAVAQSPAIASVYVKDTGCVYKVGVSTHPCSVAPGMTVNIIGTTSESQPGPSSFVIARHRPFTWANTKVVVTVNAATPNTSLMLETLGGAFSNGVPYNALAPLITSVVVGTCTYVPNQSPSLCLITPGTRVTINGSYWTGDRWRFRHYLRLRSASDDH